MTRNGNTEHHSKNTTARTRKTTNSEHTETQGETQGENTEAQSANKTNGTADDNSKGDRAARSRQHTTGGYERTHAPEKSRTRT